MQGVTILTKAKEIEQAKKRRANLLADITKRGWTVSRFAEKHGITASRMGKLLRMAKIEETHRHEHI